MRITRLLRFVSKLVITGPDECWEFQGNRHTRGYGKFKESDGKQSIASRVAYELFNDCVIPDGLDALHTCDNPPCCNPRHLYLGDDEQNAKDRCDRGRSNTPTGTTHANAKLTTDEIAAIRATPNTVSQQKLADMYGVCQSQISKIKRNVRRTVS